MLIKSGMKLIRDMWAVVTSIPTVLSVALNRSIGLQEGINYKAEIGKEVYNARVLSSKRLNHEDVVILEALRRSNVVLAYGIEDDKLQEVLRKGLVAK